MTRRIQFASVLALVCGAMVYPGHRAHAQLCDIDADGLCNNRDLRVLYEDIDVAAGTGPSDMNLDGMVDNSDIGEWLMDAGILNLGRPYRPGDADLNGFVNGTDFGIWDANFGAIGLPSAHWENGNFDGNEGGHFVVDGRDYITFLLNESYVPEPSALMLFMIGGLLALTNRIRFL